MGWKRKMWNLRCEIIEELARRRNWSDRYSWSVMITLRRVELKICCAGATVCEG